MHINKKMYEMLDIKSAEQYIYLGSVEKTIYFIHKVNMQNIALSRISYYIYDIMICNKMINSNDKDIVIFEFDKDRQRIIIIQHDTNVNKKNYEYRQLLDDYRQLVESTRNNIFLILYNYKSADYYTFELDTKCPDIKYILYNPEIKYVTTKRQLN
jgi:hypothetical protein